MADRKPWPKLSVTLRYARRADLCQRCGGDGAPGGELSRWLEHDEEDHPTAVAVVLCAACAEAVIERHPRLYREMDRNEPHPGSMALCTGCHYHEGLACTHPDLKANGGTGLLVVGPEPRGIFWDGVTKGGGRRTGWYELHWPGPPTSCAGRVMQKEVVP